VQAELTRIRHVLDPVEAELWQRADELDGPEARPRAEWAQTVWATVEPALRALGV
jgi:hypothetical protein